MFYSVFFLKSNSIWCSKAPIWNVPTPAVWHLNQLTITARKGKVKKSCPKVSASLVHLIFFFPFKVFFYSGISSVNWILGQKKFYFLIKNNFFSWPKKFFSHQNKNVFFLEKKQAKLFLDQKFNLPKKSQNRKKTNVNEKENFFLWTKVQFTEEIPMLKRTKWEKNLNGPQTIRFILDKFIRQLGISFIKLFLIVIVQAQK